MLSERDDTMPNKNDYGKKMSVLYKIVEFFVWLFSPKFKCRNPEVLPDEPCIIVGNHSQMYGPILGELYIPGKHYIWCAGEMMNRREVADYAFTDFWSFKPKWSLWFYKILARIITPLALLLFNNAHTVPVYHDTRLRNTFRISMDLLSEGNSIVIFPEFNEESNNILYAFQDKFIDIAALYYKKTGTILKFVPMYIAPKRKEFYFGAPVSFDPSASIKLERERICTYLHNTITCIARSLPEHTVVPYRNIRKSDYPKNTDENIGDAAARNRRIPVDYSGFSLRKLNDPRFKHIKLLSGWIAYFALYFLTENLIPYENCHVVHSIVDDMIPFCEYFAVFYVSWYVLLVFSLAYFFFFDVDSFSKLQIFIIITQLFAMAVYIIWPNRQDLRPEIFERRNIFTWIMGIIYAFDTPTGVCPSLHVAYSLGMWSVWWKKKNASRLWKAVLFIWIVMISASVLFVKQHSYYDVVAALPLGLLAELLVYWKPYWKPRLMGKRSEALS